MSVPIPHTAMVLAAGLGTRMRPLTNACPKPLIEVRGRKLIDRVIGPLRTAGVKRLVVNVHYLADQIETYLEALEGFEVVVSDERGEVLETGGGLAKARGLLGDDPIFVLNTDAFWFPEDAAPLVALAAAFDPAAEDERLLVADTGKALGFDGPGDFFMATDGQLRRRGDADTAPWAYAGVRIMKPQVYDGMAVERFSAVKIWDKLIPQGRIKGLALDAFWLHVGDPQALKDAEMWVLCHGG
ncbi:nucleotidyltransferase family protein [Hyphomonas sp. WL0036]|uniref:nucleotidyltransferase family protein n=1 Tax=Hyphomonas sediminis TaxID=2866160 RepID=UPI001C8070AE|nr:nucleotidyltransferase family protein [Hyphomonas sediminis]MBY9067704.1 nucleotidyltransferase family protein [Hyphomonas sediminis]